MTEMPTQGDKRDRPALNAMRDLGRRRPPERSGERSGGFLATVQLQLVSRDDSTADE